jgi:hypothetical protein
MAHAIRSLEDLNALRVRRARRGIDSVALELVADPALRARLEAPLNRYVASCGCGTGAAFVTIGLIVLVAEEFYTSGPIDVGVIARAIGILVALGLFGKLLGLLGAEWKLRATLREIALRCS